MPGTRCISGRELAHLYKRLGPRRTIQHLEEALEKKLLKPQDFSIRDLAENLVENGREWVYSMNPGKSGFHHLLEAGTVDYGHFSNITGQIFFTMVKEAYEDEEFVFSKLIPTKPSTILDTEKIPGIGNMGDQFATPLAEGEAYPHVNVVEDYIEVAAKQKRGRIIAVTKEAIAGDKTGVLLERCQRLGFYLGLNKEKRLIDCVIDENAGAVSITAGGHRYHWKGTSYATYQATSPWINSVTSNALNNWKNVESVELKLAAITDPYTGEPILIQPTHLIVTPDLKHTAYRIMQATNVQTHSGGYATTGELQDYHAPSPLDPYKILTSRLLKARLATDTSWFLGNPSKAFAYFENWGIQTAQQGAGSEDDFNRDVVMKFKASERGAAATIEPRLMAKSAA